MTRRKREKGLSFKPRSTSARRPSSAQELADGGGKVDLEKEPNPLRAMESVRKHGAILNDHARPSSAFSSGTGRSDPTRGVSTATRWVPPSKRLPPSRPQTPVWSTATAFNPNAKMLHGARITHNPELYA